MGANSPVEPEAGLSESRVTQEVLDLGDVRLGLRRTPGRGHPLVMFHGLMDSAESWDPFAQAISRPTLAFDLPGFGLSTLAGDELEKWQELFCDTFELLGMESCFLLGHSLGGAVASALSAVRPEKTRGLMLLAPAGYGRIPLAQILARPEIEFLLGHTAPEAMRFRPLVGLAYRNLFSHHHDLSDGLMGRLVSSRRKLVPGIRQAMHILRELSHHPFEENPYQGPVSALWGEHDRLVPPGRSMHGLLKVFPKATEVIFEGIGHHPQEECPGQTLDWISEWGESSVTQPLMLAAGEPLFS